MQPKIAREFRALKAMTVSELRARYEDVFDEAPRSGNKTFLWKRIAWRLQALEQGDLTERARQRAEELANDADLRIRAPRRAFEDEPDAEQTRVVSFSPAYDPRLPMPGTVLTREHNGELISVIVLDDGFEHDGKRYRSLSGVARAVTGTSWNGFVFFGLTSNRKEKQA